MPLVMLVTKVYTSRPDAKKDVTWHVAMRPGKRKELDKENDPIDALIDQVEKIKASIRTKVEHTLQGDQAAVWINQGALPGSEEEHVTAQDAVCAVQPVDGAPPIAGGAGMCAPEDRQGAATAARKASGQPKSKAHLQEKRAASAPSENCGLVALTNSSCSGHPLVCTLRRWLKGLSLCHGRGQRSCALV